MSIELMGEYNGLPTEIDNAEIEKKPQDANHRCHDDIANDKPNEKGDCAPIQPHTACRKQNPLDYPTDEKRKP